MRSNVAVLNRNGTDIGLFSVDCHVVVRNKPRSIDYDACIAIRSNSRRAGCPDSRSVLEHNAAASNELKIANGVVGRRVIHRAGRLVHRERARLDRRAVNDDVALFGGDLHIAIPGRDPLLDIDRRRTWIANDGNRHGLRRYSSSGFGTERNDCRAIARLATCRI